MLRLGSGSDVGLFHVLTVLEDGRLITTILDGATNPFVERRLTTTGVLLLRHELDATGLTDTSANYPPISKPGIEPPARGTFRHILEVGLSDSGMATISWTSVFDDENLYYEPSPARVALDALAARLSTLSEWLPANAWADANAKPYVPARYRILIEKQQWGGSLDALPVESAAVAWPLGEGIDSFGEIMGNGARCGVVNDAEALAVIEALKSAGADGAVPGFGLAERATSMLVSIFIKPILPDETTCVGGTMLFN